jgi:hypothetical protein
MSSLPHEQEVDPLDREFAPGWRPDEGDKVRGTVVGIDLASRAAEYGGGEYPVVTIRLATGHSARTKDGLVTDEVALHAIHSALAGKFAALAPKVGDEIGVKFVGEPLGSARSKRYRVDRTVDGGGEPSAEVDWADYRFPGEELPEHSRDLHRPLEDDSDATTQAAIEAERDQRDGAVDDIPF